MLMFVLALLGLVNFASAQCTITFGPGVRATTAGGCTGTLAASQTCTIECSNGYTAGSGSDTYSCDAGSTLTGGDLACAADACTANVPTGAGYGNECASFVTDGSCTQMCTAGYTDNNSGNGQTYTCNEGTFAATLLVCQENSCSAPPNVASPVTVSFSNGDINNSVATYGCIAGYTYSGDASVTCGATTNNAAWPSPTATPTCTPFNCVRPADLTGYTVTTEAVLAAPETSFDVTVACDTPDYVGTSPTATACTVADGEYALSGCGPKPTMGLGFDGPLCSEFTGQIGTMKRGDFVPVCIVLSNDTHSYKSVFYPMVDEYTLLEIDNSWGGTFSWWGDHLGSALAKFQLHIEINGIRSSLVQVQAGGVQIPYWTMSAQLKDGVLSPASPFVWDNDGGAGCFGGCIPNSCLTGFCGVQTTACGDAEGETDCDLKVYLGWYGTDSDGLYLTSASKRLSAFRSWSLVEVFQSAAQTAQNSAPDPDALWADVKDLTGGIF